MSRPKPIILLDHTNPKTYKSEQVLVADGIYAVFCKGKPINVRSLNKLLDKPGPKYRKIAFSNKGPAFNLCEKLNKLFKTTDFSVVRLNSGEIILEDQE
jgi:hypothetical protein